MQKQLQIVIIDTGGIVLMSVKMVVVGSIAYDSLETPKGKRDKVLGGSASYFSTVASYFTKVGLVGVAGKDFKPP